MSCAGWSCARDMCIVWVPDLLTSFGWDLPFVRPLGEEPPPQFKPTGVSIYINTLQENISASRIKIDSAAFRRWRTQQVEASSGGAGGSSEGAAGSKREEPPSVHEGRGSKRTCTPARENMLESSGSGGSGSDADASGSDEGGAGGSQQQAIVL